MGALLLLAAYAAPWAAGRWLNVIKGSRPHALLAAACVAVATVGFFIASAELAYYTTGKG